jgi:hypothetical protein
MKHVLFLLAFACATTQQHGELYERPASPAARVQVIQLGWNAIEDQQVINHPPVVDEMSPKRYRGLVLEEAKDLTAQCNAGQPSFDSHLRGRENEGSPDPMPIDPQSRNAYRDAALRLHVGECALVEGPVADYVVKRLE